MEHTQFTTENHCNKIQQLLHKPENKDLISQILDIVAYYNTQYAEDVYLRIKDELEVKRASNLSKSLITNTTAETERPSLYDVLKPKMDEVYQQLDDNQLPAPPEVIYTINGMSDSELAASLDHKSSVIREYETFRAYTSTLKNDHVAELDMIFFLKNILWSSNIELAATIIKDYGMESRVQQWLAAIEKIK